MVLSEASAARGNASAIAGVMRKEAAFENKPNHLRHVENQIRYADAIGQAAVEEVKAWVMKELPQMVQKAVEDSVRQQQVKVKVDEGSLAEAKRKINDLFKSIFH